MLVIISLEDGRSHLSFRAKLKTKADFLMVKWCKTFDVPKDKVYLRTAKGKRVQANETLQSLCFEKNNTRVAYLIVEKFVCE